MAFLERDLESSGACPTGKGEIVGNAYGIYGRGNIKQYPLRFGRRFPDTSSPRQFFDTMLEQIETARRRSIAAITIAKYCSNDVHLHEPLRGNTRLERIATFILVDPDSPVRRVHTPSGEEIAAGIIRPDIDGVASLQPVLYLPVTELERRSKPIVGVTEAATSNGTDQKLYIALRETDNLHFIAA
jgi:hypothetical protein